MRETDVAGAPRSGSGAIAGSGRSLGGPLEMTRRLTDFRPPGAEGEAGAKRVRIGGAAVDLCTRQQALDAMRQRLIDGGRPLVVASANLDHIHHFGAGGKYASLVTDGERAAEWLVLLDGMPLVWRARRLTGNAAVPRLAGSDLITDTLVLAQQERRVVGFLGGTSEVHEALRDRLAATVSDVEVGGCWAPSRADLLDDARGQALAREIREADVDMLYICLGKPRQEVWAARHVQATGAAVSLLFGAAADFLAGRQHRAPEFMRANGLEWAYRLGREPRRLSRRYLVQGPPALWRTMFTGDESAT